MAKIAPQLAERFTYAHYRIWPEDEHWELQNGEAVAMSPAPSTRHQFLVGNLFRVVAGKLRGHPCKALVAPTDVLLPDFADQPADEVATVVQPDVLVVCDPNKIRPAHIYGAPDIVAEVLSPSTAMRDTGSKRDLYQRSGVKELWLLDPVHNTLTRYRNDGVGYGKPEIFGPDDSLESVAVAGLVVELGEVFEVLPGA